MLEIYEFYLVWWTSKIQHWNCFQNVKGSVIKQWIFLVSLHFRTRFDREENNISCRNFYSQSLLDDNQGCCMLCCFFLVWDTDKKSAHKAHQSVPVSGPMWQTKKCRIWDLLDSLLRKQHYSITSLDVASGIKSCCGSGRGRDGSEICGEKNILFKKNISDIRLTQNTPRFLMMSYISSHHNGKNKRSHVCLLVPRPSGYLCSLQKTVPGNTAPGFRPKPAHTSLTPSNSAEGRVHLIDVRYEFAWFGTLPLWRGMVQNRTFPKENLLVQWILTWSKTLRKDTNHETTKEEANLPIHIIQRFWIKSPNSRIYFAVNRNECATTEYFFTEKALPRAGDCERLV